MQQVIIGLDNLDMLPEIAAYGPSDADLGLEEITGEESDDDDDINNDDYEEVIIQYSKLSVLLCLTSEEVV